MFQVLPSGYESMCCNFCNGCHARKNHICPYKYCMPVAICKNCKATSEEFKRFKTKAAHEHCRTASLEYDKRLDARESLKQKGVICSAIGDKDNSVVVYTTLGLYYRLPEGAYDREKNDTEEGTIDGLRSAGFNIINVNEEAFRAAQFS